MRDETYDDDASDVMLAMREKLEQVRQRRQDMAEDSGLVFCLPSSLFNPYSGE